MIEDTTEVSFSAYTNIHGKVDIEATRLTLKGAAYFYLAADPSNVVSVTTLSVSESSELNITAPRRLATNFAMTLGATDVVVDASSKFWIDEDVTLTFQTESMSIDGEMGNGTVDFTNVNSLQTFETGASSIVNINPARTDLIVDVATLDFQGEVTFQSGIDISGCNLFRINNAGTMTITANITETPTMKLSCATVTINGTFMPSASVVASDINNFLVGTSGFFYFVPGSDFLADNIDIEGYFHSNTSLNFGGINRDTLHDFEIHDNATFILDGDASFPFTDTSSIGTVAAKINGVVNFGKLKASYGSTTGWESLIIGSYGDVTFEPEDGNLYVDNLQVSGRMKSMLPLLIQDKASGRDLDFTINDGGEVYLDYNATHPCGDPDPFAGHSQIYMDSLTMNEGSTFYGGSLLWEADTATINGNFYYEAYNESTKVNNMQVGGILESCNPVTFTGVTLPKVNSITISGNLKLDSVANHQVGGLDNSSVTVLNVIALELAGSGRYKSI